MHSYYRIEYLDDRLLTFRRRPRTASEITEIALERNWSENRGPS